MSRNNHFFFSYIGNKRTEFNNIYEKFKIINENNTIDKIYEPFCGSFAFSYFLSTLEPNKYEYHLNDMDSDLILLCQISQDEDKFNLLINELNDMIPLMTKETYKVWKTDPSLKCYVFTSKVYGFRKGVYPLKTINNFDKMRTCPVINFLKTEKIIFTNNTITKIDEIYNKPNFFIFMDPPYIANFSNLYKNEDMNIYEYLHNNKINDFKAIIMLVLQDMWIIRLLFNNNIKESYEKKYEISKKKTNHLIIDNFK